MPGILDMTQGVLDPTSTYAVREWRWVPCSPWCSPDTREGTLSIVLQHGRRRGRKSPVAIEVDHYGLQEDFEEPAPPVEPADRSGRARVFLLLNDTPPADEGEDRDEVYRCVVGGTREHCTCTAGRFWVQCKHVDAIRDMIAGGVL